MPSHKNTSASAPAAERGPRSAGALSPKPVKPVARFRVRVTAGDVVAIGPGKIALLEAIAATGSITEAAKSLDMSYRRAWVLLDDLNKALRHPAVESAKGGQRGGGSALTDVGRQLLETYRRIEDTAATACAPDIKRLLALIAPG